MDAARPTGKLSEELLERSRPKASSTMKWLKSLKGHEPTLSELDQIRQNIGGVAAALDPDERRLGM